MTPLKIVQSGLCIGCGSCVAQSDSPAARIEFNQFGELRPFGDNWIDKDSSRFAKTCPFSPEAPNEGQLAAELFPNAPIHETIGRFHSAYVGACEEGGFRDRGSSGGMVSWLLEELFRRGLVDGVAHVVPVQDRQAGERFFGYRISRSTDEIREGAKSRYYPVEMAGILREIALIPGRYAVVGVPCFIKSIQLLRRENRLFQERIVFTVGLFCGHMKSASFAGSIARQLGVEDGNVRAIDFRIKDPSRPASTYTAELTLRDGSTRRRDWWNLVDGDWALVSFNILPATFATTSSPRRRMCRLETRGSSPIAQMAVAPTSSLFAPRKSKT